MGRRPTGFAIPHICEPGEFGEFRSGQHAGLVDDHCRARWKIEPCAGWSGEAVLNQEYVECVRCDPGLLGQHFGGGGGGRHPEHDPACGFNLGDCWCQRGCLPGAGRADDQHDVGVARDCARGGGLGDVQLLRAADDRVGILAAVTREAPIDPVDQGLFLIEDRLAGQGAVGD